MTTERLRESEKAEPRCRWSYASALSFAFCATHGDYHRTFMTPPTICPTAIALAKTIERRVRGQ